MKVRTISASQSKLIIYICISLNSVITKEVIKGLLLEFNEMIYRKEIEEQNSMVFQKTEIGDTEGNYTAECDSEENDDDDFKTVRGSEEFVGFMEGDGEEYDEDGILKHKKTIDMQNVSVVINAPTKLGYLTTYHSQKPEEAEKYHKFMKKHYLFGDWVRIKEGGVLCTNEAQIQTQKSLFKSALTKMGKNLLRGELLRISLPVVIFRDESHL